MKTWPVILKTNVQIEVNNARCSISFKERLLVWCHHFLKLDIAAKDSTETS